MERISLTSLPMVEGGYSSVMVVKVLPEEEEESWRVACERRVDLMALSIAPRDIFALFVIEVEGERLLKWI